MWLANQTRSDIVNAVRAVARYENKPREMHWSTAIGILEYVFSFPRVESEEQHANFRTRSLSNAAFCSHRDFLINI